MEKYVYVVGGSQSYYRPFVSFGKYIDNRDNIDPESISLVVFTGGEDVGPRMYNEKKGSRTYCNDYRDEYELKEFQWAQQHNLPITGICRGAQFLSVMSGGKLVQHITGHSGNHSMKLWDGRIIEVSSTHHQMQLPPDTAEVIGWAEPKLSKCYLDGNDNNIKMEKEIEIVYYPKINAIGMQHHPEFMNKKSDGFKIASELVRDFLNVHEENLEEMQEAV